MSRTVAFGSVLLATTMLSSPLAAAQEGEDVEKIVVRGAFIPEPQRETSQVATFVTQADLARTGDADAAIALTRLSGLSIVADRFAYVRGLGDRYSLAMLNGSPLPSSEPLRRTVPLDLFPADLLDGITVQKTYSAHYPADFGGGVIDMRTLRQAREDYVAAAGSIGANTVTLEEDGVFVRGGDADWTGYDDGLRKVPVRLRQIFASGLRMDQLDDETVELAGESLVNAPLSVLQAGSLAPDVEIDLEAGKSIETPRLTVGLIGALGYDQGWTTERAVRQIQDNGAIGIDLDTLETTQDIGLNALGVAGLSWGEQYVQSTLFYVHSTSKEAQIDRGPDFNAPFSGVVDDESSSWIERELAMLQLSGEHRLGPFALGWRGAAAESTRDAPYERNLRRILNNDGVPAYLFANQYRTRFSELSDTITSGGADISYAFATGEGRESTLTAGLDYSLTERDYGFNEVFFTGGNALPADVQIARPDFLFSPDNIDPARFVLRERLSPSDSHTAELEILAAFAEADLELLPYVRATLGVRYEDAEQQVQTFNRLGALGAGAELADDYVLPSAVLTWNFADDLQLRLGYARTIARPQFRELAQSLFFDPATDREYRGNSALVDSELRNYDIRLERYAGRDSLITLAGFYKEIDNPIEEILFSTSAFRYQSRFINTPSARLYGGELELRRYFELPADTGWLAARKWRTALNYTYTTSEVEAPAGARIAVGVDEVTGLTEFRDASLFGIDGATLQGAPENILNLQLGWEADRDELTLLVGWVDERILQRGDRGAGLPDVVEDPGVQLDLVYRRFFDIGGAELTLGLAGRNLLDEEHVELQRGVSAGGDPLVTSFNTYDRGRSFSLSLSSRF